MPTLTKSRHWLITLGLLALVAAMLVGSFLTRDLGPAQPALTAQKKMGPAPLVDESPLQTARAMGRLASGADEQQVAAEAERLADSEVDLAFHDASREAADHPPQSQPQFRELYEHAGQAQTQVQADQALVDELKKQSASASGTRAASVQEQLDVAQAQSELDQDELDDAKEDLVRSGADPGALIQRQFDQHQAAEHGDEQKPAAANTPEVNYQAGHLLAQFNAWRALRGKIAQLHQARDEAGQFATALNQAHDSLHQQLTAAKAKTLGSRGQPNSGPAGSAAQPQTAGPTVKSLRILSDDQKNLADLDKRIQDQQELQKTYGAWISLVQAHQRTALHGMIQSALWILVILLVIYVTDQTIDHYIAGVGQERARLHTLRAVIRFAVQIVGVLLILLVILGPPQQLPTILGFAGAGLTVALKDFIVGFFGWFVLMGRNGLRVGDWVEIEGVVGEVIEINLLRTVLLETGNWTTTGHPTGRKVAFVNSYAIEGHFFNFTTSGQWLWDELRIPVPSTLDPALIDAIQKAVAKETEANARAAEQEWEKVSSRYKVRSVSAIPAVNLHSGPSGMELHVRYITRAHERSAVRSKLNQVVVQLLQHKDATDKENQARAVDVRG